ncbi:MAG: efflux RND transporter permease subunit [Spirochaetaceae bacterium]|nr:efflux RND transporter permease subunit [Spirochaetaceae bacterium]
MNIAKFSVKHPAVIGMILIVLVAFGIISVTGMNIAFMSDISMPEVMVLTIYPGAGAEDVEQDVTNILENDFVTLPNFKNISSSSSNSVSLITISFQDGVNANDQLSEVRHRITQKMKDLPEGIETPNAFVAGVSMLPVLTFSVEGGKDLGRVTEYVNKTLKPQLTSISGVSEVTVSGSKELQVNIKLRTKDLTAKGIPVAQVYQIVNYGNVNLPVGNAEYESKTIDVRFSGGFSSIQDIQNLPVGTGDENVIIRLKDIADVELIYPKDDVIVTDGKENIVVVDITKRSDGNVMKIVKEAKKVLAESEKSTNGTLKYNIISDDSRTISASLSTVITSGISGVIMAIIVLFLFLNDSRSTMIIGISIPLSILFTFIGMKLLRITINLMSLSGIVTALGMIVDGSIVMIEQVYRYYSAKKSDGKQLYSVEDSIYKGSSEVASSIFASTTTTVIVFFPIVGLSGIVGKILKDVSLTIILSLIASVLVALIVVPFLMKQLLNPSGAKIKKQTLFNKFISKIETAYKKVLSWILQNGKFVLVISISLLIISVILIGALGISFIPSTDNSDFYVYLEFPIGQSLEETELRMKQSEKLISNAIPEIKTAVYYSGNSGGMAAGDSPNAGYAHIVLVPVSERTRRIHTIILETQKLLSSNIPDAKVKVSNGGFDKLVGYVSGGGGYGLTLVSEDMNLLLSEANRIEDFLKTDIEVVTTNVDTSFDNTTLVMDMSHEYMSSLGITSYEAGITSAILFSGMNSGKFTDENGNRYSIKLESDITDKQITKDTISNINIKSLSGKNISFDSISNTKINQSISQINHSDRAKTVTISATLVSEDTSGVATRVNEYLNLHPLKEGVKSKTGGIMELLGDAIPPMISALFIACFLVYTVMVLQFEKFKQPLLVMGTIPFCLIGVVLGLMIFGSTLSLISLMGIIALAGVVVNNGIILIDYINLLRKQNLKNNKKENNQTLKEIIITGSASRVRPILMTTLTTMLGVVPMAMAKGEGAEIYAPLGQAISGGLLTSTIITLFIIPVLYFMTEKNKQENKFNEDIKDEN